MVLDVLETIVISPSAPPVPSEIRPLPLSHLDNDVNLRIPFRTLRVFAGVDGSSVDPTTTFASALSQSLPFFLPLASPLIPSPSTSLLHSHVSSPTNVLLHRAASSVPLLALLRLLDSEPGSPFLDCLAPDPSPVEALARPLAFQVTRFACGGFTLGMCVHHALCDGAGATQFLAAVGRAARGLGGPAVEPVWDREVLLGPRSPPRLGHPFHDFLAFDGKGLPYDDGRIGNTPPARVFFHVSNTRLEQLRTAMAAMAGSSFTGFEALGAYIWRARVIAKGLDCRERVTFVYSMSIKMVAKPELPDGYWGNTCVPVYVCLLAGELLGNPLWETAMLIKKSKQGMTNEYVRSFIDFQEMNYTKGITAGKEVSGFTDWRRLSHHEVDFGWGGPVAVSPLTWRLLGSNEPSFFLPYAETGVEKKDCGFRVLVCLPEDVIAVFREEMATFEQSTFRWRL